jgi:hypothetical protein
MDPTHEPNSFEHAADTVKSALLAIVLRHYGLELRQERDDALTASRPERLRQAA